MRKVEAADARRQVAAGQAAGGPPPLQATTISAKPGYGTGGPSITVFIMLPGVFGSGCVCAVAALHQFIVMSGSVQADIGVGEGEDG